MEIQHFFDQATSTLTYVVYDGSTGIVIDPVLDFDPKSARTSVNSAETAAQYIDNRHISITYVIDTHAHADHLTAMPFFKKRYGARTVTGSRVGEVQRSFRDIYNLGADFPVDDGSSISCSTKDRISSSVRSASVPCTRLGTHRRTCPGKSKMLFSSEIRFSCRTMARRAVTFPADPPISFTIPASVFMRCRTAQGSLCVTTINPAAARCVS